MRWKDDKIYPRQERQGGMSLCMPDVITHLYFAEEITPLLRQARRWDVGTNLIADLWSDRGWSTEMQSLDSRRELRLELSAILANIPGIHRTDREKKVAHTSISPRECLTRCQILLSVHTCLAASGACGPWGACHLRSSRVICSSSNLESQSARTSVQWHVRLRIIKLSTALIVIH